MDSNQYNEPSPGINLGDVYFAIFRHKWKILLLTAAGVAAAATFFYLKQPPYQSEAKLLVRYISDVRAQTPVESNSQVTPVLDLAKAVLNSEVEILTSFDLAKEVATNVGPDKILAKLDGGSDPIAAAGVVSKGLKVEVAPDSSVIHLTFQHPDPGIVQPVLSEIIKDYFDMHMQVHKAGGISDELLSAETDQLRLQIQQTDDELRAAKTNAGIVDIADSQKAYSDEIARIRTELLETEARIAEHKAFLKRYANKKEMPAATASVASATSSNTPPNVSTASPSTNSIPPDQYDDYRAICTRLAYLQKTEDDYLSKQGYTEDNRLVKEVRGQIAEANKIKTGFETKYPALAESAAPSPISLVATDATQFAQAEEILALPDKLTILQTQLQKIQNDAAGLDEAEAKISDLQRIQNIQEKNYSSLENSLEQARIDATFGPGRVSGINSIQAPTPPFRQTSKFFKTILMLLAGGVAAGFGLAFLIEFFLDTSVKRPAEVQARLKMPFFLAIPYVSRNHHGRLASTTRRQIEYKSGEPESTGASSSVQNNVVQIPPPWEVNPALRAYSDALRDRLVMYFDSINLTRKPKLVAVTSASRGSGVSTVAAGLAASLSETGDGRVLLVDMNVELGAVQQFLHGKPGCKLDDAFEHEKRQSAQVQENLYVVAENSVFEKLPRVLPKRFAALVPKLRASDYDYIIFDMPPVSPTSVTSRLSGFMDKVLLVVESEKTDRNIVLQASTLLSQSKANASVVLNKARRYVPAFLLRDFNFGA